MKKTVVTGKTQEQLMDILKEQKAEMVKAQMTFGPKPSVAGIRKNIARIMTELSSLKKNSQ